jgi:Zn-dependent protease with chaperone function
VTALVARARRRVLARGSDAVVERYASRVRPAACTLVASTLLALVATAASAASARPPSGAAARVEMRATAAARPPAAAATTVVKPAASPTSTSTSTSAWPAANPASTPVPVPSPSAQALRYYRTGNVLWLVAALWGLASPALVLWSGLSARLRDLARRPAARLARPWLAWLALVAVYGVLFTGVTFLLDLPLAWYVDYARPHAYGLSVETAAKWWGDAAKGLAVSCAGTAPLLWLLYGLLRWSPRRWWLWAGLASVPALAVVLVVSPLWIDPLFDDFGPLRDPALATRILALASRAGIDHAHVFEVAKSVETTTVNAYVTGFLGTQRIVLWDTLLAKLAPRETLVILGHEMGHYVLGHVWWTLVLGGVLSLAGLWCVHRTADALLARHARRFGFDALADVASVPLVALLFGAAMLVAQPLALAESRHEEHEADRFALELTRDNQACATAFVRLQEENLSVPRPGPLYRLLRASHPSLGDRIDFCNTYRPWAEGQPLRYGAYLRP